MTALASIWFRVSDNSTEDCLLIAHISESLAERLVKNLRNDVPDYVWWVE